MNNTNENGKERKYTVYMHTSPSGKRYIGITQQDVNKRWKNGYGYKAQAYFYKSINKYGWDNFKHEILYDGLTKESAEQKEVELIAFYKSDDCNYGYNIEHGGNSIGKMSNETKKKISEINKRENLTEETLRKRSMAQRGRILSEETKKKMSELWYDTHQESKCKRVSQYTRNGALLKTWNSVREAGRSFNINGSLISQCCSGNRKTAAGYIWKYENEELTQDEIYLRNKKIFSQKKHVLQYSKDGILINEYMDVSSASLSTGVNSTNIYQCCRYDKKCAGGYIWRYVDEE